MRGINQFALEPMSNVDTAWLRMDSNENLMVINGLLFFDEPMTQAEFRNILEQRLIAQHKRFRQRPVEQFGHYYWQELKHLDMNYHLTSLEVESGSNEDEALRRKVSTMIPEPLDSKHPLWRFYFVENHGKGCVALVKVHHCYADGIALFSVLDSIADESVLHSSPAAKFRFPVRKPKSNSLGHRLQFAVSSALFYCAFAAAWVFECLRVTFARPDSKTAYKRTLTPTKQVGWAPSLPVSEVKQVGKALGCTVNDVVLGCVAGSLRRYLQRLGEPVDGICLRATVPVNLRPLDQALQLGNHFGLVYLELPVAEDSVSARIKGVRRNMSKLKNGMQAQMSYNVLSVLGYFPNLVEKWALNFFSSKASAVMTNVPGPTKPVVLMGKTLSKPMFWVPQSGDIGIGVSVLSYNKKVEFGFVADSALIPDAQAMVEDFMDEFQQIKREIIGSPVRTEKKKEALVH